jgi:hypothetical protein
VEEEVVDRSEYYWSTAPRRSVRIKSSPGTADAEAAAAQAVWAVRAERLVPTVKAGSTRLPVGTAVKGAMVVREVRGQGVRAVPAWGLS